MSEQPNKPKSRFAFNYDAFREFQKTIGPIEERVILADFMNMVAGNSSFEDRSSPEMEDALWIFKHGWLCARLAMTE